jgi:hypothetical protein
VFTAHSSQKAFAPSKKPPLFRQKGTQSCLEIRTQTIVAKLNSTRVKGQRIHDFRALLKYFFLAENRAETAPRAAGMAVFAPFCWERTLQPPGNFSEEIRLSAQRRCSGWVYAMNDGRS